MRIELCIPPLNRAFFFLFFAERTLLGSKPCGDSCLVDHLNKFSNFRGKNSPSAGAHSTGQRLKNSLPNNKCTIVQVTRLMFWFFFPCASMKND